MNIKSLLLGSAAALVAVTGARAADAVVVAEPEPVEYVRVCDVYGAGFYYMPGTETCLKVSGYFRYDIGVGDDGVSDFGRISVDKRDFLDDILDNGIIDTTDTDADGAWYKRARFQLRVDARSETELGTLRAYLAANFQYTVNQVGDDLNINNAFEQDAVSFDVTTASDAFALEHAYLELGGFRAGKTDSLFSTFTGYAGGVIHDDLIPYGPYDAFQLAYTWTGGNGFTAAVALEDPAGGDDQFYGAPFYTLDDYIPNVVAGVGWTGGWGGVSVVGAYDAVWENFAVKGRLDMKFGEAFSAFIMAGWADKDEVEFFPGTTDPIARRLAEPNYYGGWGGDWAIWGGGTWQFTPQAAANLQISYDDWENFVAVANVAYELVPGFTITPEIAYYDNFSDDCVTGNFGGLCTFDDDGNAVSDSGFGGFLRLQRNF
jgi:Porin subfamily